MKKDPNAPKKPLSPYFLFWQDERLKVKAQFPDYSITEEAKEVGRRWKVIDPTLKAAYQQKYQGHYLDHECFPTERNLNFDCPQINQMKKSIDSWKTPSLAQ